MKQQIFNPYLPSYEYVPDGEPYVFGDRLYVFGSHDRFGALAYCDNDYVCWSAPVKDLSDWICHGTIYRKNQDPLNPKGKMQLWAPDVQQGPDGRYYLYYAFTFKGCLGVAVADQPEGPYTFYGHVRYADGTTTGTKPGEAFQFDPGVLVDENGQVYVYTGFAPTGTFPGTKGARHEGGYVMELEEDMLTIKAEPVCIFPMAGRAGGSGFEGHEFFEASSIRKIGDVYYFVYSSINGHELCYATAQSPTGPFTYGGVIVSNGDIGYKGRTAAEAVACTANNHGGLVQVNGQWYIFYHRHTNRQQASRQGCAEPVELRPDGSIPQVEMTSCGLNGGPLFGVGSYEARIACNLRGKEGAFQYPYYMLPFQKTKAPYLTQSGADREEKGDQYIANLRDGAMAGFKYFDLQVTTRLAVTVRGKAEGVMEVRCEESGPVLAKLPIRAAKGRALYTVCVNFAPGKTRQALYFTYRGRGKLDFISFELS